MMFRNDSKCFFPSCTDDDSQYHIYTSKCFSTQNEVTDKIYDYSEFFTTNISAQICIERIFVRKLEERRKYKTLYDKEFPVDPRIKVPGIKKAIHKVKIKRGNKHMNNTAHKEKYIHIS